MMATKKTARIAEERAGRESQCNRESKPGEPAVNPLAAGDHQRVKHPNEIMTTKTKKARAGKDRTGQRSRDGSQANPATVPVKTEFLTPTRQPEPEQPPPPPQALNAEQGVIGCCLLDAVLCLPEVIKAKLTCFMFYDLRNRKIFETLLAMHKDGLGIDVITLYERLKGQRDAPDLGYLSTLPEAVPSVHNLSYYFEPLRQAHSKRALLELSGKIDELAHDPQIDSEEMFESVTASIQSLREHGAGQHAAQQLESREFRADIKPPALRSVYSLLDHPICTPANLTTITSAVKTGKSAVIGALVASTMSDHGTADTLGFKSSNPEGWALLWFDTEQSPDDFWHCVNRALRRAHTQKPPWLHAYHLKGMDPQAAWEFVRQAVQVAAAQHGRVHSTLIDGSADLVHDVNDPLESNGRVRELDELGVRFDCPVIGVIHLNPGTEKSRGHFGSQLERKAETNLMLEMDEEQVTVIYGTKNRRAPILKASGARFAWGTEADMHVTVGVRQTAKAQGLTEVFTDVFELEKRPGMRYCELVTALQKHCRVGERAAEKRITEAFKTTVIKKSVGGLWVLST